MSDFHITATLLAQLLVLADQEARAQERRRCAAAVCQGCQEGWLFDSTEAQHYAPGGAMLWCAAQAIRKLTNQKGV